MTRARVHAVLPDGVDDPSQPSGGNVYDRRVCAGLVGRGWRVVEHHVPGEWPAPDRAALGLLDRALAGCSDGEAVLVDGLVACCAPDVLLRHRDRVRLVVLVHLPLGVESEAARTGERAVLAGCAAVVTTSAWTRTWLLEHYRLDGSAVRVVRPGVDAGPTGAATGRRTSGGPDLLVVGRVCRAKGHDVLAEALADVADLPWRCTWVGSLEADPPFVAAVRDRLGAAGVAGRVALVGTFAPGAMGTAYASSDLVVVPSRLETYGMVVTEALAHGVPVVASDVGGVPESLAPGPGGRRPGLLVPPADAPALARALRGWLTDPPLRGALTDAARARRPALGGWDVASGRLAGVLTDALAGMRAGVRGDGFTGLHRGGPR